jgi:hypothetical protein
MFTVWVVLARNTAAHGDGVRLDQAAGRGVLAGEVPPGQVEVVQPVGLRQMTENEQCDLGAGRRVQI